MPNAGKVRWREADEAKLKNLVKRFNAKVARNVKKGGLIAEVQPAPIKTAELRETLKAISRRDVNYTFQKLENYLRKGAEMPYTTKKGVNTTVWQKKEIDRAIRTINARNRKELSDYEIGPYKGNIGTIERSNMRPRKNRVQTLEPKDWDRYVERLDRQVYATNISAKSARYKENFLKAIETTFGSNSKLYQAIRKIPPEMLHEYYYTDPILTVQFVSDPREAEEIQRRMLDRLDEEGLLLE